MTPTLNKMCPQIECDSKNDVLALRPSKSQQSSRATQWRRKNNDGRSVSRVE